MKTEEKIEMLRSTIVQLYCNEGRSISYISRLLSIDRSKLSKKIREWELEPAEPRRHVTPSTQKFINRNRKKIKDMLDRDTTISEIAREYNMERSSLVRTYILQDGVLKKAYEDANRRREIRHREIAEKAMRDSSRKYDYEDLPDEEWKSILGYSRYMVSTHGRIKARNKRYDSWYLISTEPNRNSGRLYVRLTNDAGKSKNLNLARIVANTFIEKADPSQNTVNHKDGDVTNNRVSNLEWMTQGENNAHSYSTLNRPKNRNHNAHTYEYDGKTYLSITALAKALGKSWTQTSRYIKNAKAHNIKIII